MSSQIKKRFNEVEINVQELGEFLETQEQIECPINHSIFGGVYVREMFIPKDTLIIGKRHRAETCNILMKGTIAIYMGPHLPLKIIVAPCVFPSEPLGRKLGYAYTDVIFVTVHPTDETDVDIMEDLLTVSDDEYREMQEIEANKQITKAV